MGHEASQRLASEVQRSLEAQEVHLHQCLQQLPWDSIQKGRRQEQSLRDDRANAEAAVLAQEHLVDCQTAVEDCARCVEEVSAKSKAIEGQLQKQEMRMRELLQNLVRDEMQQGLGASKQQTNLEAKEDRADKSVQHLVEELRQDLKSKRIALLSPYSA